jgi:hypothetical protein
MSASVYEPLAAVSREFDCRIARCKKTAKTFPNVCAPIDRYALTFCDMLNESDIDGPKPLYCAGAAYTRLLYSCVVSLVFLLHKLSKTAKFRTLYSPSGGKSRSADA